jgi:DNA-binding NtrC family response regulator
VDGPASVTEARAARIERDKDSPVLEQVTKAKQQAEIEAILSALNATRWNRKQAAALLKIDYKALLYKMKRLGVEENFRPFSATSPEPQEPNKISAIA